jgi:hypothetical protein
MQEKDQELVDVLTAISIVSKRLARKLAVILRQETNRKDDEHDERTVTADR